MLPGIGQHLRQPAHEEVRRDWNHPGKSIEVLGPAAAAAAAGCGGFENVAVRETMFKGQCGSLARVLVEWLTTAGTSQASVRNLEAPRAAGVKEATVTTSLRNHVPCACRPLCCGCGSEEADFAVARLVKTEMCSNGRPFVL